jgi:hypothetical protein
VKDLKQHLIHGTLEVTGRLVDASNATLFGKITYESEEVECIYKPIAGERPLWDFPDGNLASREFAAYILSDEGGFNLVPTTILRDGAFGAGMVQLWIDIDESIDLSQYFSSDLPELRKMALFDAVINNTDRKIGHLLPTKSGKLFGCDHGVTFHRDNKLRTVLWQWAGEKLSSNEILLLEALLLKIDGGLELVLQDLITDEEIYALRQRIEGLLQMGRMPLPNPDWPAIPWPAF